MTMIDGSDRNEMSRYSNSRSMYDVADCMETANRSRRVPPADSSREARYSMLATRPASNGGLMRADLQARDPGGVRVERIEPNELDDVRIAKDEGADGGPAPGERVHRDDVRVDLVDVDQTVGRGRRMVDDDEAAVACINWWRPEIGHGAERRRCRGDRDQPGRLLDQVLPLPRRQFAGLDIDFGPFHLGAIPIRGAKPRRDVCFVVQPCDNGFIAQADAR